MGLLFSKDTKSTNNYSLRNNFRSESKNVDNRAAADNGAIITRGTVNVLDGGAVSGALDLATRTSLGAFDSLETIAALSGDVYDGALSTTSNMFSQALDEISGTSDRAFEIAERSSNEAAASASLAEKLINIAVPLGVVFAVAWAWKK